MFIILCVTFVLLKRIISIQFKDNPTEYLA